MIPMSHADSRFVDFTIVGAMVIRVLRNPCWSRDPFMLYVVYTINYDVVVIYVV